VDEKLTREHVKALPPGRVLDGLVAENVFDFRVVADPACRRGVAMRDGNGSPTDLPHYSSEIAAGWDVFCFMCGHLFSTRLHFLANLHLQARTPEGYLPVGMHALCAMRHRFPEAVCKAALVTLLPRRGGAEGGTDGRGKAGQVSHGVLGDLPEI
jgi:hypothetical protein